MTDEKPRLIQPSVIGELKAQNTELSTSISELKDEIAELRRGVDRHQVTLNLILGLLDQIANPSKTTCPF